MNCWPRGQMRQSTVGSSRALTRPAPILTPWQGKHLPSMCGGAFNEERWA